MATIADYPDAVQRIVSPDSDDELPDSATTVEEVTDALQARGENRLTQDLIENLAESVVTESDVRELIAGSDELPDRETVESLSELADEYDMGNRSSEIAEQVADEILTEEELDEITAENPTNDELRDAINESESEVLGPDVSDIVEDTPTVEDVLNESEQTAPSESELEQLAEEIIDDGGRSGVVAERAAEESVTQEQFNSEVAQQIGQETPEDISTGVGVLSDSDGEAVAVFGGTSESRREQAAEDLGGDVQDLGGNVNDALSSIEQVETGGGSVEAQIDGRQIAEISPGD